MISKSNKNVDKFYKFLATSYLLVLVSFATFTHLGLLDLQFYDKILNRNGFNEFIKFVFYCLNIYFLMIIIFRTTKTKNIKYFIIYIILTVPTIFLPEKFDILPHFLLPILFIIAIYFLQQFKNITLKELSKRYLVFFLFTGVVQFLLFFVRYGEIDLGAMQHQTSKNTIIISIDLLIFYYIFFKVVVTNDAKIRFFDFFHAKKISVSKTCNDLQEILNLEELKLQQKAVFYLLAYGYQFLTLFIVLGIGKINNKLFELTLMLLIFWFGRRVLGNSWHAKDLWLCSTITFISFYILTLFPFVDFKISLFAGIALSASFVYVLYKLSEFQEFYEELKKIHDDFHQFDLLKCGKEEIIDRCNLVGLSKADTNIVIDIFYNKMSTYELSEKLHITTGSLRNKKTKLKKRLLSQI